jgi:hypothetical protein
MSKKGWNVEVYYQGDEVLMFYMNIDQIGLFFRYDGEWEPTMPEDMDLSDAELVSIKKDDVKKVLDMYDAKDPDLVNFLASYEEEEENGEN